MMVSSGSFVIAGGGTGGHLYPGIALARELQSQEKEIKIFFVGTSKGIEMQVLPREGFPLELVRVEGLLGKGVLRGIRVICGLPLSLWDSFRILKKIRPVLVIGVGGYASGPFLLASALKGIPRVILEQNVIPGMTNRFLASWMDKVVVSFEKSRSYFGKIPVEVLGNPVRGELLKNREFSMKEKERTLLVVGGSRGAHRINLAMVEALTILKKEVQNLFIIHQTGESDFLWVQREYEKCGIRGRVSPFIYDMAESYKQADLVVSRAGATTVAEITVCGLPAILIPYPYASHNHQLKNAEVLEKAGAARVIEDEACDGPRLASEILALINAADRLSEMRSISLGLGYPQAVRDIAHLCLSLVEEKRRSGVS